MLTFNMPHVLWLCLYQERPRKPIYFLFCVTVSDISVQEELKEVLCFSVFLHKVEFEGIELDKQQCNDARLQRRNNLEIDMYRKAYKIYSTILDHFFIGFLFILL